MIQSAPRRSGVLLPAASLPSRFGIGGIGREAFAFADRLAEAGQQLWQVLPLGTPDFVHSPYASPSAFAGNPYLLDMYALAQDGLLSPRDVQNKEGEIPAGRLDYRRGEAVKGELLRRAYAAFRGNEGEEYEAFCRRERHWLADFALYDALKTYFGGRPFWQWEEGARCRRPAALRRYRQMLSEEIGFCTFTQYLFSVQMGRLREYLSRRGIALMGDIPFYVARDSADVWAHPELFLLHEDLTPRLVAGVPPDYFSAEGQLWGNPVYDWSRAEEDGYRWWIRRLTRCAGLYDVTRLDHFRAFDSYYTVRASAKTARVGRWRRGPGEAFFDAVRRKLPGISLVAEDLGQLFPSVHTLRRSLGMPGMRVLQFAFDGDAANPFLPHNYDADTVAYLGTHDNDTSVGVWEKMDGGSRAYASSYLGIRQDASPREAVRAMMRAVSASAADTVIFTVQDLEGQGSEARINTPSRVGGCWEYVCGPEVLSEDAFTYLKNITRLYGRWRDHHE